MQRKLAVSLLFFFMTFAAVAQRPATVRKDTIGVNPTDTAAKPMVINAGKQVKIAVDTGKTKYVNPGKIAGRKAVISSLIVPGMGQIRNGVTVYRLAKVAGIYTGATLLTISLIDNSKMYKVFLKEVQVRKENGDVPVNPAYRSYPTSGLIIAKDNARRNKEVVIFSLVGLYLLNAVEAYIDARLKYFDVDDVASLKISPGLMNTNNMYGFNPVVPGVKLSLTF